MPTTTIPATLSSGYSVAAGVDPAGWHYANQTQKLANNLPMHSKIRQLKHSVGQTFLNGIAGVHLEAAEEALEDLLRQQFLATITIDELDVVATVEAPGWISMSEPIKRINYVYNSSFEIWTNQAALPDGWNSLSKVSVVTGLEGRNAVRLAPTSGKTASIFQDLTVRIKTNETWSASVFYNIATNTLTAPASNFGIKLTASHVDGTSTVTESIFNATTNGKWIRKSISFSFSKETSSLRIEVLVKDTATFAFSDKTIDVDCVQVEPGGKSSSWRPDILDVLPYGNSTKRSPIYLAGSNTAHYVDNLDDFWSSSVPTRVGLVSTTGGSYTAVTTAGTVEVTDFYKDTWTFLFENIGSKIRKRGSDVSGDVIQDYDIYSRRYDGTLSRIVDPTIEGITFFADRLWVVLKERNLDGDVVRTLHVVEPRTPHPEPTYLESIASVSIPSSLIPLGTTISRVEIKSEDRQHIYLSSTTNQYALRLYYDLFTVDTQAGIIYLRENYTSVIPV